MAIVTFSRKEFEKFVKIDKKIEEKIDLFGTPIESINEKEINIEIFPNRPDLLSLHGYIRAFLAFIGKKTGLKNYVINEPENKYEVKIMPSVKKIRPYTACAIVKDLNFNEEKINEVINIQEKLHETFGRNRKKLAIGIYPLEKISMPIKFEAIEPNKIKFVPLGENKEMNGWEILEKHPAGVKYGHLIKNLKKWPVFIDSNKKILSMPPIINSEETGKITKDTKEIFIECSGFDLDSLKKTLNILVTMFGDMGGKIYKMKLNYGLHKEITPNLEPERMSINIKNINRILGLNLNEKEIKRLLERMGYGYENSFVKIPAWRTDVLHEIDIIEDVAIAYGYNKFTPQLLESNTIGESSKKEERKTKIANLLIGLGFLEIMSPHIITQECLRMSGYKEAISVEKSKTDYKLLRPSLICSILNVLADNTHADYPQKLFEIGIAFNKDKNKETGINENEKLCVAIVPGNITEIKQVINYLGLNLDKQFRFEETEHVSLIEGRTAKILLDKTEIGVMGEVHPSILKAGHIKLPVAILEINLETLI